MEDSERLGEVRLWMVSWPFNVPEETRALAETNLHGIKNLPQFRFFTLSGGEMPDGGASPVEDGRARQRWKDLVAELFEEEVVVVGVIISNAFPEVFEAVGLPLSGNLDQSVIVVSLSIFDEEGI